MEETKTFTSVLVCVDIPDAAFAQAWLRETPASLTLCTPKATVQVQIGKFPATDARQLPYPPLAG